MSKAISRRNFLMATGAVGAALSPSELVRQSELKCQKPGCAVLREVLLLFLALSLPAFLFLLFHFKHSFFITFC